MAYRPVVDDSGAEGGVARHGSVDRILRELHAVDLIERRRLDGPETNKQKNRKQNMISGAANA